MHTQFMKCTTVWAEYEGKEFVLSFIEEILDAKLLLAKCFSKCLGIILF